MIADVDKDGSGAIDLDEFEHMMTAKIGERDSKEELMKAFHIIDQDNNVSFFIWTWGMYFAIWCLILISFVCRERYQLETLSVLRGSWV